MVAAPTKIATKSPTKIKTLNKLSVEKKMAVAEATAIFIWYFIIPAYLPVQCTQDQEAFCW